MTEKRFECDKGSRIIIDNETKLHYIMTLDWECSLVTKLLNRFADENEQLKKENQRMTDKLNELALELLNYDMVTMGKATEISEMCYYDFLKYRKDNGNPMELQL